MNRKTRKANQLLARTRRIRGQVEGIERALVADAACGDVLQRIAGARGALDGLMSEVLEDHITQHLVDGSPHARRAAADELLDIVRSYFK